ncbi:ABC transporter permease [Actinophytocola sp. NPDC049390]|uniref:ABC transporter permease n=1 Tax=Actinophytocola sp. NPDC049390 TaxID=3363894 RepID=UPI00379C9938
MTTTTTRTAVTAQDRGSALTGTGALVRFILRRDRVRIPVWLAALTITTVGTAQSFQDLYGDDADRARTAETMGTPAGLAMTGPAHYLENYTLGAMMSHQMLGFMAIMVGLMSVLAVVRHTRAEEETGRAELVRANVVGRHAHLVAALVVVTATNVVLALLIAAGLGGLGMAGITWPGALLYGAAHAAAGIVFAGAAAVTVQITDHSRGASGLALAVVGVAYVLRAAGDVGDNGLSWLSPIGWIQATWAFLENRWWPLLLALALAAALVLVAFRLSVRRDVGAALRQPRRGAAAASNALANPIGFALRLHRGLMFGFGVAMLLLGITYGSILGEAEDMLAGIDVFSDVIAEIGGASVAESFASMVMVIMAIIASVYVVMAALRPRAEENAGRAEPVLATALSRTRWLGSHLVVVLIGSVVMLLAAGLGIGLSGASSMGDAAMAGKLVGASLAYLPALWVIAGVAVVLVGLAPRVAALAWVVPLYAFLVGYLGQILQFPTWMNNLSPFGHIPQLPVDDLDLVPLVVLTGLAAVLAACGLLAFREREVNVT